MNLESRHQSKLYVPEGPTLTVLSLNTGLSGRQNFRGPELLRPPFPRFENMLDFIYREKPDVITLQEVYEEDRERIQNALGGQVVVSQLCVLTETDKPEEAKKWGVAFGAISKYPIKDWKEDYYFGTKADSEIVVLKNANTTTNSLLTATIEIGSERFTTSTTHFPHHNEAEPSPRQLEAFKRFTPLLRMRVPDLLTGDFNSPRGKRIFDSIAKMYTDYIPEEVNTTFDVTVRPEITWELVVDGFFLRITKNSKRGYKVEKIKLVQGLSDHKGILAEVQGLAIAG